MPPRQDSSSDSSDSDKEQTRLGRDRQTPPTEQIP